MASRRVLVFDDDSDFLTLLKSTLGEYGFEIQAVDPRSDDIHRVKELKPEAIFIAADDPKKLGYALCTKLKKSVGKKIPIILATSTISPRNFALHGKMKMRADAYLDKRSLSRGELLHNLDELVGLGTRTGPLPPVDNEDMPDMLELSSAEAKEDTDIIDLEEIVPAFEILDETIESEDDTIDSVPDQTDVMDDQTVDNEVNSHNGLDHRFDEQEKEIIRLQRDLEDARRASRASPFSSDFLNLQEEATQKDLEIERLKKKIYDIKNEISSTQEPLKALVQKLTEENRQASNILAQEQQEHQQTRQNFEAKVADLQLTIKDTEKQHVAQMYDAEENHKSYLLKAEEEHRRELKDLEMNFTEQIAQFKKEKYDEIESLRQRANDEAQEASEFRQRANDEAQKASDMLTEERQSHQETRQNFEAKIAELQDQHNAALEQAELEMHSAHESSLKQIQEELTEAEKDHKNTLNALEEKYEAQIAQLIDDKKAEIETLRQIQEELTKAEKDHKHALNALEEEYKAQIAQLKDDKKAEIEVLRQEAIEEPQKVADILVKEQHQQISQQLEDKIHDLQAAINDAEMQQEAQLRDEEVTPKEEKPETDLLKDEEELEVDLEAPEEKKPTKQISPPLKEEKDEIEEEEPPDDDEEPPDEWLEL
jgi:CheY-like chemotaxis protein